jgi:hypothetical protein
MKERVYYYSIVTQNQRIILWQVPIKFFKNYKIPTQIKGNFDTFEIFMGTCNIIINHELL